MIRYTTQHILLLPVIILLLVACNGVQDDIPLVGGNTRTLTINVNVPGMNIAPTYALDAIDECEIQYMDVLVFNAADNTLLYAVEGENIQIPDLKKPNEQTFNIQIEQTPDIESIFLVFIANARPAITEAKTNNIIVKGTKRETIIKALTFQADGKWPVKPGKFTRFPMWGESEKINISGAIQVNTISLVRSVAKIDVGINYNESTQNFDGLTTTFKMEAIYLCHSYNRLQICPNATYVNEARNSVSAPSIPVNAAENSQIQYLVNGENDNSTKIAFTNRIYTAEREKEKVCLVIGGYYSTSGVVGTTLSYYRIDFLQTVSGENGEIIEQISSPLLRNHLYRINITAVRGPGYSSVDAALAADASNLVVQFTDNDLSDTDYNQYYNLGVDKTSFRFNKEEQKDPKIVISTTYSKGWTATADSWITLGKKTGEASDHSLTFTLPKNETGLQRSGKITVAAGKLSKEITVVQEAIANLEVSNVVEKYVMDSGKTYTLTVKSIYDWQVKITDPSMILRTFTTSGTSNTSGTSFQFTLMDKTEDATATLTFYSLTGDFSPVNVVINGIKK